MKSIFDPSFRYTASFDTDLHKTFARIRRELRPEAEWPGPATPLPLATLSSIVRIKAIGRG